MSGETENASSAALVVVTSSFPIRRDGSEAAGSFVADLVESLSRRLPVRVVAPGPNDEHERWEDRVDVVRFAAPSRPLSTLRPWNPVDVHAIFGVMKAGRKAALDAVCAGPTSHILALWALPCGDWARRVSLQTGTPYSVWTLGSDIWSLGRIPLVRAYLQRILGGASHCFSDGIKLAEDTQRIARRPVEFLASTRSIRRRRSEPLRSGPPYRLLFLGRWHANKGVDLLMESLKLLTDKVWQRIESVEILGGGPLEATVKAEAALLQADRRPVRVGGFVAKADAEDAMLRADYLLIPSRIESIPVVFSDAMKLDCPVISTPVGDLPRLIEGEMPAGVLADECTAPAFATAIGAATRQSAAAFAGGLELRKSQFDLDAIVDRLYGIACA